MGVIEALKNTSEKAVETGDTYLKKTQEYYTLKVFQQLAISASLFCKMLLIGSFIFLGVIFLSVAATMALGAFLGNVPLGCLIIAAVLFVIAGIVYFFRKKIDAKIIYKLSEEFFNETV
tara:strand:+ start:1039 stop:1395 length:357 start_codon:yes stop_codon:yes gene_type:complete